MFNADVTYKIWMVVDYTLNYYETYIQGGQWAEQTKLDTEDLSNIWLFRVNPAAEDVVSNFQVSLSRGNTVGGEKGLDPTYFDNVAVDTSCANLSAPVVPDNGFGDWAVWPIINEAGDVNTGAWMGFVNVAFDPWIWSYSLNQWLYIDAGTVTEGGSWVYIFNY